MSALDDIAAKDGIIAGVYTTVSKHQDAYTGVGDGKWCAKLLPWIHAAVVMECQTANINIINVLLDGPGIRIEVDGEDVCAVVFVPGSRIVKNLARMTRRVMCEARKARNGSGKVAS